MVAQTISLPNVRKMFIPDDGMMMIDVDLERADAQVVAWEAGDEELKDLFRSGADVHTENACAIFRLPAEEITYYKRQQCKQAVHGFDYGGSAKTIAAETGMSLNEALVFEARWFSLHPKIKEWHNKIKHQLETTQTVHNAFGYRNVFFDRIDVNRWHEALAWIPQSTVAIVTNLGLVNIYNNLKEVNLLLQVHDSLVMQAPLVSCPDIYQKITNEMRIEVPYFDPLFIPCNAAVSELSWGDLIELTSVPHLFEAAKETTDTVALSKKFKTTPECVARVLNNREHYAKAA